MEDIWKGLSILVVDDTPKVVTALKALYNQMGLDVVGHAENGMEALALVRELRPDIISMDIIMPEMDGVECFRRLRDNEEFAVKRPKIFFMTYLATEPKILEAYKEEIPEYLFVAKTYAQESVRNVLAKLFAISAPPPPKDNIASVETDGPTVG